MGSEWESDNGNGTCCSSKRVATMLFHALAYLLALYEQAGIIAIGSLPLAIFFCPPQNNVTNIVSPKNNVQYNVTYIVENPHKNNVINNVTNIVPLKHCPKHSHQHCCTW
jgi:hypothetical protein